MRGSHGTPLIRGCREFYAGIPAFRRYPLAGVGSRCLKWLQHNATTKEPQMITAFFVFVTTAFFVAIVANVVESVGAARFA